MYLELLLINLAWDNDLLKQNIGVDISLLKNRLGIGYDYYDKFTDQLISMASAVDVPLSVGGGGYAEEILLP